MLIIIGLWKKLQRTRVVLPVTLPSKIRIIDVVKPIEVSAPSGRGFDDAIKNCVAKIAQTVKSMDTVSIKDLSVHLKGNAIESYGVVCNVSFRVAGPVRHLPG